ncbi:aminotransferase class I/II-fold pyridoxal phosphate-dependent enzyme [uncultured Cloacibacillus sp.]|uniref:DegT/DnrJ/EryC1/StrS family aminotransferase n=1 Tax=uncultured Cloacibacillus sp. TaxID=889794 RepID=UPI0025E27A59|nr:aminotransferase class I/II-fold pyridoxal phosphate-dependent enzyme [uncultured Cloacibacillus sp.]
MLSRSDKRILLSYPHMSGDELRLVKDAFESNWIAPLGPHVDAFEKETAAYAGVKSALALSSGSAAIHLGLRLLDVKAGDIVFCSTLTFIASVAPAIYQNAIPVFIDSDEETWNMSPVALQKAFDDAVKTGKMPKCVIVAELYGQPPKIDEICAICDKYNVPILEDSAEALGATYDGRKCGSFGKVGVYSYNGNKIITTSGGGMLLSDDEAYIDKARFWSTQARDKAPWYEHTEIGYNYRMSNILAAIGRGQMRHLEERINRRRAIYRKYKQELEKVPGITLMTETPNCRSIQWLTAITVDKETTGKTFMDVINYLNDMNIESRPVWKPMHLQPYFMERNTKYFPHGEGDNTSVSDRLFNTGICLPSASAMTDEEQEYVIEAIKESIAG